MIVLPVVNNDGCWAVDGEIPADAVTTVLTPQGCTVYQVGDKLPEVAQTKE